MNINDLVHHLTVPCADNGYQFTRTERIDQINSFLVHSAYSLAASSPLSFLWKHRDFNPEKPVILVSSHIDSLYNLYHCIQQDDVFKGTFDNSITNAVIIHLMLENALPPQVLVAFTGDEEDSSRGADYIMSDLEALRKH